MNGRPAEWKVGTSRTIADCRVFTVRADESRRLSDGNEAEFFVIENPDWVNIIALTANDEVVLIEQFRHGTKETALELPGGMIDPGESPEAAARRELLEETGYTSDNWTEIGRSRPNPALQNNTIYHFLARDCVKTAEVRFDEHESISTTLAGLEDVHRLVRSGDIDHSLVISAFYFLDHPQQL